MSQAVADVYPDRILELEPEAAPEVEPVLQSSGGVGLLDYLASMGLCTVVFFIASMVNTQVFHWFAIPCWICGVMMGADTVAWLRGRLDTFDPKALIGLVGVHFFYVSSLIFVASDMQMLYVSNPEHWRPWLGYMGLLNLAGLLLYRAGSWLAERNPRPPRTIWVANRFAFPIFTVFLCVSLFMQLLVMIQFGGLAGMFSVKDQDPNSLVGWGQPRLIGGSFTLLAFLLMTLLRLDKKRAKGSNATIMAFLGVAVVVQFLIAGYSHSRGQMIFPIFWMLILIHYFWRHIKVKMFLLLIVIAIPLMLVYSFYKTLGSDALAMWKTYRSLDVMQAKSDRSLSGVLVGDLARADVQAYLVYKQVTDPGGYDLRHGKTYYLFWTQVVPRALWRNRPLVGAKVLAGTERLHGKGYYKPLTKRKSTRAYGLAGEAILNFGVWSAPLPFFIWGLLVGRLRRYLMTCYPKDLRLLMVPYLLWLFVNMLVWDVDNHLAHTMIRAFISLLAIWLSVTKAPYDPERDEILAQQTV